MKDTAQLNGDDGLVRNYGPLAININADARVVLTITKTMDVTILQGDENVTFSFTVSKEGFTKDVNVTFAAGDEASKDIVVSDLEPGTYKVTENPTAGFYAVEGAVVENIDLNLPNCAQPAIFNNELSDEQTVAVSKTTSPTGHDGDWNMTLYSVVGETLTPVSSLLTTMNAGEEFFTIDGLLDEGNYTILETMKTGWYKSARSTSCDFSVNYPSDYNTAYTCSYTNTKYAEIIVKKVTDPTGSDVAFGFTFDNAPFSLVDGNMTSYGDLKPGVYTVVENDPTPAFDLVGLVCEEVDIDQTTVDPNKVTIDGATATIDLRAGATVTCTYTNRERGMVELIKTENGGVPTMPWNFSLTGPEVNTVGTVPIGPSDPLTFTDAKLVPGENYALCETGVPVAWTVVWMLDGKVVDATHTNLSSDESNEDQCVEISVTAGQTVQVAIDNSYTPPGGEPRTIGYWKNWSTCSNGNQAQKAADNGGVAANIYLIDDVLTITLGDYGVTTCEDAVSILNKSDVNSGKKRASDAAYGLASQLLAAMANEKVGACKGASDTIAEANTFLMELTPSFDGSGEFLTPKKDRKGPNAGKRAKANELAGILDSYNNGELCP